MVSYLPNVVTINSVVLIYIHAQVAVGVKHLVRHTYSGSLAYTKRAHTSMLTLITETYTYLLHKYTLICAPRLYTNIQLSGSLHQWVESA